MALLLRMAGIARIGAICDDYPGSLLDVRHHVSGTIHEVERALSLVRAMGYELDAGDNVALLLEGVPAAAPAIARGGDYVVVHPGATVEARRWSAEKNAALVRELNARGHCVVVTGSAQEAALTAEVAGHYAIDLGGQTDFAEFAAIVRDARAVVCGNTVASHVAAAMRTPVVCIFPPTIPAVRFAPWQVPHVLLGDQAAPCAGCRSRVCPVEGQPCLAALTPQSVANALDRLTGGVLAA